jgi:dUTP pyrophosphatase
MFNEDLDFLKNKAEELKRMANIDLDDLSYDEIMGEFGLDLKQLEDDMMNSRTKLPLGFVKLHTDAVTPKYNYDSDSGFDLRASEDKWIFPNSRVLIPTGLKFDIPDGYEIQVRSKSGLALNQGLFVLNSPGTVDSGYLGEIQVILFNTTQEKVKIEKGQKIAQAVLCPVVSGKWVNLTQISNLGSKDRNDNGFGSTGLV